MGHSIRMIIQFSASSGTHQRIYDHVTAWNDAELLILIETIDEWPNERPRILREISTKNNDPKTNNRNMPKYGHYQHYSHQWKAGDPSGVQRTSIAEFLRIGALSFGQVLRHLLP
jgi:hypothetical protein